MSIAIIGTGNVGTALAVALSTAGHDVIAASRHPEARADFIIPVASYAAAAAGASIVINATPGIDTLDSFAAEDPSWLDGKIVLDVANAGTSEGELVYPNDSLARQLQATYPNSRVVKALNTVNTSVMTNPTVLGSPTTAYLAGDDAEAKAVVSGLLVDLGWPEDWQVDLGGIDAARALEHFFPLFLGTYRSLGSLTFNHALIR